MDRSMITVIDPETPTQPSDRIGHAACKPPLKRCKPITRSGISRTIEAMPTENRADVFDILEGSKPITPPALRAGPTTSVSKCLRWNTRTLENLTPTPSGYSLKLIDGDRMGSGFMLGVVMLPIHRSPLFCCRAIRWADTVATVQP
jgi:hypothetical protein